MANRITLEVCVDNVHGLAAAIDGGADRIELCSALGVGGLTPTSGLLRAASGSFVPVVAMIRPRGGDFCFDEAETQLMLAEIDAVAAAGLQGVVLGASLPDGQLDEGTLRRLVRHAADRGLRCTLHRAIDLCPDLAQATRLAIELGFERILTSGGATRAPDGLAGLQQCFDAAGGRITVMPGAGISADNVDLLRARLPLTDVHASCSVPLPAPAANVAYTDNFAPDGVLLLQQKRVDAGIEDSSLLDYLASKNAQFETLPAMYGNTPIGIAMAKGDPALLKFVNGFVSDYVKSGAYAANYRKWWGAKAVPPALAPQG